MQARVDTEALRALAQFWVMPEMKPVREFLQAEAAAGMNSLITLADDTQLHRMQGKVGYLHEFLSLAQSAQDKLLSNRPTP